MRETLAVFKREVRSLFVGPIPYLVVALFAAFGAWWVLYKQMFFVLRRASLEPLFSALPYMFCVIVPAIAMRTWSEEIRGETLEPLLTSPIRTRHAVLGKFLAGLVVLALCLVATVGLPLTVGSLGNPDGGALAAGYLGALLMGAAYLAIGMWLSGKTRNQIVAFLCGVVLCFVWTVADWLGTSAATGSLGALLADLSFAGRYRAVAQGVLDLRDVAYFASIIGFFLYLNVETVENRRSA